MHDSVVDHALKQCLEGLEAVPTVEKQHGEHLPRFAGQAQYQVLLDGGRAIRYPQLPPFVPESRRLGDQCPSSLQCAGVVWTNQLRQHGVTVAVDAHVTSHF